MIVNRGPQLVQFVNGYRNLGSAGSNNSAKQSAQVAASAGTYFEDRSEEALSRIAKALSWFLTIGKYQALRFLQAAVDLI